MLALGKLLHLLQPPAVATAQEAEQERPETPTQLQELAWSNPWLPALPNSPGDDRITIKLVVTNMATNQQTSLVLDMRERYLLELSVSG